MRPAGDSSRWSKGLQRAPTFDPARFVLPDLAKVLVAVEGTGGSACKVYAYEKIDGVWKLKVTSDGYLGANGMSNHRHSGDKTTPLVCSA